MKPFRSELVTIRKCDQLKNRLLIAIDAGNVFTKVLFLNKNNKEQLLNKDEASLNMEFSLFFSKDFENALEWVRDNAYLPEDSSYKLHITGSLVYQHQNQIKSILNRDVIYIDKLSAVTRGCKFAIEHIGVENLLVKPGDLDSYGEIKNEFIDRFLESWKKKLTTDKKSTNDAYPSMFHMEGSRSLSCFFDGNGKCSNLDILYPGGQTFLGLSKCLLNTNNYDEIIDLASKGNKCNLDTQAKEMFDMDIKSPYGKFPPEMPMFPFGKCMDYSQGTEILRKEDMAVSLMSFHCQNMLMHCTAICLTKKISQVFISGNLFSSACLQREFYSIPFLALSVIKFEILNFVYPEVLGAMVSDDNN